MLSPAFEWLADGQEVRMQAFAFCEIGQHHSILCAPHEHFLLHFVLRGQGYIDCPKGRFDLREGSVAVIPPMTGKSLNGVGPIRHISAAHHSGSPIDGIARVSSFDEAPDLLIGCAALDVDSLGLSPALAAMDVPLVFSISETSGDRPFWTMRDEMQELRVGSRAFLSAIMKQLVGSLFRSQLTEKPQSRSSPTIDPRLQRAINTVISTPGAHHSVGTLATDAAMSRATFSSHFLTAYGCTPMAFVQSVRLARAATLLATTTMPIKSVAVSVGYSSRSQFSKAFRVRYGKDPTAFRMNRPAA